jgi:hypothetical protein
VLIQAACSPEVPLDRVTSQNPESLQLRLVSLPVNSSMKSLETLKFVGLKGIPCRLREGCSGKVYPCVNLHS